MQKYINWESTGKLHKNRFTKLFFRAPSKDLIKEYRAKVGFLQKVVDDAKATSDASDLPDSVHYRLKDSGRTFGSSSSATLAQAPVSSVGPFRPPPGP